VSIFFLDPEKGSSLLLRIKTRDRPTVGLIVSGIIVTCRSALAINRSLVCFARCTDATKQRTVVYLSGKGGSRVDVSAAVGADN